MSDGRDIRDAGDVEMGSELCIYLLPDQLLDAILSNFILTTHKLL